MYIKFYSLIQKKQLKILKNAFILEYFILINC